MLKRIQISGLCGILAFVCHAPQAAPEKPYSTTRPVESGNTYSQNNMSVISEPTTLSSISSGAQASNRAYTAAGRDPFSVTNAMLQLNTKSGSSIEFTQIEDIKVPSMRLRGLIENDSENKMAALLEVSGLGTFVVREGDTIGLSGMGKNNVLFIEKVTNLSLVVKAGHVGQRFIVR